MEKFDAMVINNLHSTFEQRLRMLRFSDASIRNHKSAVDNFLRLVSAKYQKPEELDAGKIEKNVFWLIETRNNRNLHAYCGYFKIRH